MLNTLYLFIALSLNPLPNVENEVVYSVYFNSKSAPGTKAVTTVNPTYFGNYELIPRSENDLRTSAGDELKIDASGIYIEKNKLLSISREEIRENSKYSIREGYLHGVVLNDSVMVALEDDSYYFLLPKKTYLYEAINKEFTMYQGNLSNEYLVLTKESNGYSSALYISFSPGKIALKELNFEQDDYDFRTVTNEKIEGASHPLYLLNPTKKEWQKIMQYFSTYDQYAKLATLD